MGIGNVARLGGDTMKMRELLTDNSRWCQNSYARDVEGISVPTLSGEAYSFCLVGALVRCYEGDGEADLIEERLLAVMNQMGVDTELGLTEWNDAPGRTFEEVKTVLEQADV